MAKGRNKVFLQGNVGADPELRYTGSGQAVVNFRLATPEVAKGRDGQYEDRTEWHSLTAWGKAAEVIAEYVRKGTRIDVEGTLRTRSYENADGQTRYATEIHVREFILLSSNGGNSSASDDDDDTLPF